MADFLSLQSLRFKADGILKRACVRYLAAKSEADHYMRELKREQEEIISVPDTGLLPSHLHFLSDI